MKKNLITPEYLEQNILLHGDEPTYGTSGWQYADAVGELMATAGVVNKTLRDGPVSVLDYGAGKGTLAKTLWARHCIKIHEYDPAIIGISDMPKRASIVVVGDVMEHIEPLCLREVLGHIHELTQRFAYFVIGTRPAGKNLPDGRNCHLIQKPAWWWANELGLSNFVITQASTGKKSEAIFTAMALTRPPRFA